MLNNTNPKATHICNSHEPELKPKFAKDYGWPQSCRKESTGMQLYM
jgi:hypothetical protein